ncbi:MAG: hypothetical protein IPK16_11855 [Anaerolineales bacterium]|nr:hypothetical protein [Anaerolineales bacterium]
MGKISYLIIGGLAGAAAGLALRYFFGPAKGTTYDANYRSRLDYALEEGRRASIDRENELRLQLKEFRRLPSEGGDSNGAGA